MLKQRLYRSVFFSGFIALSGLSCASVAFCFVGGPNLAAESHPGFILMLAVQGSVQKEAQLEYILATWMCSVLRCFFSALQSKGVGRKLRKSSRAKPRKDEKSPWTVHSFRKKKAPPKPNKHHLKNNTSKKQKHLGFNTKRRPRTPRKLPFSVETPVETLW